MISVCMATYNGAAYIREQLDSILKQLSVNDELIISDDGSKDATLEIISTYMQQYPNIILLEGPRKGVIKNFENAFYKASGDFIFLSDQDDIWMEGKVEKVLNCFKEEKCNVVLHDAMIVDGSGALLEESFYAHRGSRRGFIANLTKNSYLGCSMAFRGSFKERVLPIPGNIEMHDWWIGMVAEMNHHSSRMIEDRLIQYRRHGDNVSSFNHYPLMKMISNRVLLLSNLVVRYFRDIGKKHA